MNHNDKTDRRRSALKRLGIAAGASALALAASSSLLSTLTACSKKPQADKLQMPPAAYSNTFPESPTPVIAADSTPQAKPAAVPPPASANATPPAQKTHSTTTPKQPVSAPAQTNRPQPVTSPPSNPAPKKPYSNIYTDYYSD